MAKSSYKETLQRASAKIKGLANKYLERRGRRIAPSSLIPSFEWLTRQLALYGLEPRTIFDIGVATGTPWLYDCYPKARYFLVDPTRESLPYMDLLAQRLRCEILNIALGESDRELEINVRPEIGGSSMFLEVGHAKIMRTYSVPVRRFDAAIGPFERPSLCKIDVQGSELNILKGAGERIDQLDVIVVETSLISTLKSAPEFFDILDFMFGSGFVLYDIVGINRRPLDNAMAQIDAVFVPTHSKLRTDRRWSAD